jgi:hypothetical protein
MQRIIRGRLVMAAVLATAAARVPAATTVTLEGDNGRGGEVCRFAAAGSDPFQRWLSSQEVTCVASGSGIELPAGLWNVFARSDGAVSADPLLVDGASPPANLTISLAPAATLDVQMASGETGVLYAPKRVAAFPVTGATRVPAAEEIWLFVLAKSGPVGVMVIPPTDAGTERRVDATSAVAAPAVVGWVQMPEPDRTAVKSARGVSLPHLRIASGGKETDAATLPPPAALDGAFVLWSGVAAGEGEVQLTGRGWLPDRQRIAVKAQAITLIRQPVVARATATLAVNWSTTDDLLALDRSFGSCEPPEGTPRFELTISSCIAPGRGEPIDAVVCKTIRTEPLLQQMTYGSVTLEEVPPGLYRAELRFGKLPRIMETATIAPLQQQPIRLQASYFSEYGSVTRAGKPLGDDARIEFPRGGVGFVARDSDEYHAVLTGPIGPDAKIEVVSCRGERTLVLSDMPMRSKTRFDIDIPDNLLTVTIVDTFTHALLGATTLRYVVMSARMPRVPVVTRTLTPGEGAAPDEAKDAPAAEGTFVFKAVPQREIRLDASRRGYKKQEIPPFSITRSEKKDLEIQLVPLQGSQGRIVSARPFQKAMLFWFSAAGAETEHADLDSDGTFLFEGTHLRDETMLVVSLSHPLWIARAPAVERGKSLEVHFPDAAPVRDVTVSIPAMPPRISTLVGVAIGGLRIPPPALAQHLGLRNIQPLLRGADPLGIPALAETGPIDILRGPAFVSTLALPLRDFAAIESRRLEAGTDTVVFRGK